MPCMYEVLRSYERIPLGDKFYQNASYSELVAPLIHGATKEDVIYKNFAMMK